MLQPIVVRPLGGAKFELVMGERRWRAAQQAAVDTIPAIVRETADHDLLRDALLENLHRAQLNPLEEAAAYQQMLEDFGCTQEELASRIKRSRPQISNTIRLLRLPLLGDLLAKVEVARFSRTLATLLANGVTLLAGLAIVRETMTNSVLARALDGVITRLREGKGFGRPLVETGLYPKLATQMILVGEESGRLEEMLNRVADVYDREVQISIKRFLAILEPAMILGLAVLIGGIVFSILLGVMGMSELVS